MLNLSLKAVSLLQHILRRMPQVRGGSIDAALATMLESTCGDEETSLQVNQLQYLICNVVDAFFWFFLESSSLLSFKTFWLLELIVFNKLTVSLSYNIVFVLLRLSS